MPTIAHETFEGGTLGVKPSTSDTVFDNLIQTGFVYDDTHLKSGSTRSVKMVATATNKQMRGTCAAQSLGYEEIWLWPEAHPSTNVTLSNFRNVADTVTLGDLQIHTDGAVYIRNTTFGTVAHSTAGLHHPGQWNKIQWYYDNVAGQMRLRWFFTDPEGNTPDYDSGIAACTKAGQIGLFQIGAINASTWTAWFDDFDLNTDGFLVPTPPPPPPGGVAYRASATPAEITTGTTISNTVPGATQVGDLIVVAFMGGLVGFTQSGPAGYTPVPIHQQGVDMALDGWAKIADGGDAGATVTVTSDNPAGYKRALHVDVFSGAKVGDATSRTATSASTAHPCPSATATDSGAWVLNGCMDKGNPASTGFTLPAGLTERSKHIGTGGGSLSSVAATSAPGAGSVGANTITGTLNTNSAATWTIILEPTAATLPVTVSAGSDLLSEPWRPVAVSPSAAGGAIDSWTWEQMSTSTLPGFTQPTAPQDMTQGATVDSDGTIHMTAPAELVPMVYTLRVTGHKAGQADVTDNVVVSVFPATRSFVRGDGRRVPLRLRQVQ